MAYIGETFFEIHTVQNGNAEGRLNIFRFTMAFLVFIICIFLINEKMKKMLTEVQAAYFAGFIDGDGSIFAQICERKDYAHKFQIKVSIVLFQKKSRKHFLTQFQGELGVGTLRERKDNIVELSFVGINTVMPLLKQIYPFLKMKRTQAKLMMQIVNQLAYTKNSSSEFLKVCKLVDIFAEYNESKNRTITTEIVTKRFQDLKLI